jgi:hypothetical protein
MPEDNQKTPDTIPAPDEFAPPVGPSWHGEQEESACQTVGESEMPTAIPSFMRGIGGIRKSATRIDPVSPYEQLIGKRDHLKLELQRVEEAIKVLEENPEIERVMRLVGRALY